MKKCFYVLLAVLGMSVASCHNQPVNPTPEDPEIDDATVESSMRLFVNDIGEIRSDTTIYIYTAMQQLSGQMQMEVSGYLENIEALRVMVSRSATDRTDELCALGTCAIGDGEAEQQFDFAVINNSLTWYAHYTLPESGDPLYTVNYKFINYSRVINLTVVYDYKETE